MNAGLNPKAEVFKDTTEKKQAPESSLFKAKGSKCVHYKLAKNLKYSTVEKIILTALILLFSGACPLNSSEV